MFDMLETLAVCFLKLSSPVQRNATHNSDISEHDITIRHSLSTISMTLDYAYLSTGCPVS